MNKRIVLWMFVMMMVLVVGVVADGEKVERVKHPDHDYYYYKSTTDHETAGKMWYLYFGGDFIGSGSAFPDFEPITDVDVFMMGQDVVEFADPPSDTVKPPGGYELKTPPAQPKVPQPQPPKKDGEPKKVDKDDKKPKTWKEVMDFLGKQKFDPKSPAAGWLNRFRKAGDNYLAMGGVFGDAADRYEALVNQLGRTGWDGKDYYEAFALEQILCGTVCRHDPDFLDDKGELDWDKILKDGAFGKEYNTAVDKRRKALKGRANTGFKAFFSHLEAFKGYGGYSKLFGIPDRNLRAWRRTIDEAFDYIGLGGIDYWEDEICHANIESLPVGIAFDPNSGVPILSAYVNAEITNITDPFGDVDDTYIYKLSYLYRLPQEPDASLAQTDKFNVYLLDSEGVKHWVYVDDDGKRLDIALEKGEDEQVSEIKIFTSERYYTKICMVTGNIHGFLTREGSRDQKSSICNNVVVAGTGIPAGDYGAVPGGSGGNQGAGPAAFNDNL